MALAIIIGHSVCWKTGSVNVGGVTGRLLMYGVSIFFLISGLSLAARYWNKLGDPASWINFYRQRLLRIYPLLWLVVLIWAVFNAMHAPLVHAPVNFYSVFINLTGLFGFIDYNYYIAFGTWFIGNILVYYSVFPFIIALFNKSRLGGNLLFALTLAIGFAIAVFAIRPNVPLSLQWESYINPLNNLYFFIAGIALYYDLKDVKISVIVNYLILAGNIAVFYFYPVSGDRAVIVTGINRVVFSLLAAMLTIVFWKTEFSLPGKIDRIWLEICQASYSIYLLQPIVWVTMYLSVRSWFGNYAEFAVTAGILGLAAGLLSYRFIELPVVKLFQGKVLIITKTDK